MGNIKNIYIDDMEELAEKVVNSSIENEMVSVIGFCEDIAALLKQILRYENINIINIELCTFAYSDYDGEYLLTITNGSDLYVDKEMQHGKYLDYDADVLYINKDCNSSIIHHNTLESAKIYVFGNKNEFDESLNVEESKSVSNSDKKENINISIQINGTPIDISEFDKAVGEMKKMLTKPPVDYYFKPFHGTFKW